MITEILLLAIMIAAFLPAIALSCVLFIGIMRWQKRFDTNPIKIIVKQCKRVLDI